MEQYAWAVRLVHSEKRNISSNAYRDAARPGGYCRATPGTEQRGFSPAVPAPDRSGRAGALRRLLLDWREEVRDAIKSRGTGVWGAGPRSGAGTAVR